MVKLFTLSGSDVELDYELALLHDIVDDSACICTEIESTSSIKSRS